MKLHLKLAIQNSETQIVFSKGYYTIRLELSASAKLAVIWIINTRALLGRKSNLDLICLILVFHCQFCTFRIILFTSYLFKTFYVREPNMHTSITGIFDF